MLNKPALQKVLSSPRVKKTGVLLLATIIVVGVVGFFVLPPIVKSVLLDKLGAALHRPVVVKSISINPYALSVTLEGVSINEREGGEGFVSFQSLYLNLESSSIFRGGPVIGEIRLVNPRLRIARLADNRYNFSDLLDEFTGQPEQTSNAPSPLFSLNNIQITGGEIEFDDLPVHHSHVVSAINLSIPFVSNMAYAVESFVEPSFSAHVNGAPLQIAGKSKPFANSLESEITLNVGDIQLGKYLEYLPFAVPIGIQSGALDSVLKLTFRQEKDKSSSLLLSGSAAIRDLDVRDASGSALLTLKQFGLELGATDLLARRFVIENVSVDSPEVFARINRQGVFNWAALAAGAPSTGKASASPPQKAEASTPVTWSLGGLSVSGGAFNVLDESRGAPFRSSIQGLEFKLGRLDSQGQTPADLSARFKLNRRGEVSLDGTLTSAPLKADLNLDIKTLELLPLQPYFSERLNVEVTRGQLTASGAIQLRQDGKAGGLTGGFSGQATVGDFQAVDKLNSADFLRWKSFYLGKIDVRHNPDSVSIGEVALSDFFARVIVSPEGKLNLMQIVRQPESAAAEVGEPLAGSAEKAAVSSSDGKAATPIEPVVTDSAPEMPVRIGKITVQGGDVRFTDNFVKPNYTANLKQIGGRITGLSSEAGSTASLELRGSYDNVAPLTVTARINPLSAKPYLDLQAEIKGLELTSFSSYAGKYAGYAIEKGKLSLFVNYKIENDQLEAENRVFIDQLTFGDGVESPDATKLPVRLAVSLLKNRNGEIDLNLPISGSLSDPQFSVGGLIVKVIVNLFVKAVTSPFALLGSMFGGEELSNLEFDVGRATITPVAEKRLDNLVKALIDRPSLKLEIEGRVDPENDREGLKHARIGLKVRALKREDQTKSGVESTAAERIEISDAEYPGLLERVYRAEKFPKPRNMIGMLKSLPVEEMEKLMLANSVVNDDDLRGLGELRARAVRDWLVSHQVPPDRIFLLPSKLGTDTDKPGADKKSPGSRVDFSLR